MLLPLPERLVEGETVLPEEFELVEAPVDPRMEVQTENVPHTVQRRALGGQVAGRDVSRRGGKQRDNLVYRRCPRNEHRWIIDRESAREVHGVDPAGL